MSDNNKPTHKVLISYCRNEPRLNDVKLLVEKVRQQSKDVDIVMEDDIDNSSSTKHGDDSSESSWTLPAIDDYDVFVIFISETFKTCPQCTKEATFIFNNRNAFVPVKMIAQLDGWIGFSVAGKLYIEFMDTENIELAAINVLVRIYGYLEKSRTNQEAYFRTQRLDLTMKADEMQQKLQQKAKIVVDWPEDNTNDPIAQLGPEVEALLKADGRLSCSVRTSEACAWSGDDTRDPNVLINYHWRYNPEQVLELYNELAKYTLCVRHGDGSGQGSTYASVAKEVDSADVIVIVFSDELKKSKLCRQSALYAKQRGKTVIAVRQQPNCVIDDWLEIVVGNSTPIDYTTDPTSAIDHIVQKISSSFGKPVSLRDQNGDMPDGGSYVSDDGSIIAFNGSRKPLVYVTHCLTERASEISHVLERLNQRPDLRFQLGKTSNTPSEVDRSAVAELIETCDMAILFVNEGMVSCRICRREIDYILAKKKRFDEGKVSTKYFVVELVEGCSNKGMQGILGVGKTPIQFQSSEHVTLEILYQIYGYLEDQGCVQLRIPELRDYYNKQRLTIQQEKWAAAARESADDDEDDLLNQRIATRRSRSSSFDEEANNGSTVSVFISYSWAVNPDGVRAVAEQLRQSTDIKLKVWLDVVDITTSIRPCMAEGVEKSDVIIIFYSREYYASDDCKKEAHYAFERNLFVIPVKMQSDCPADGWLAVRLNEKQTSIEFENVEQVTQEIIARILVSRNLQLVKVNVQTTEFSQIENHQDVTNLQSHLKSLCNQSTESCRTLLVTGKPESGKTSLVGNFLGQSDNDAFLLNECHVRYVVWLNLLDVCNSSSDASVLQAKFLRSLEKLCREALKMSILAESFSAINSAINNATADGCLFLLVLDDVSNEAIFQLLSQLTPAVRCLAIAEVQGEDLVSRGLVSAAFEVAPSFDQIKTMFANFDTIEHSRLQVLTRRCQEVPALMTLVQSTLKQLRGNEKEFIDSLTSDDDINSEVFSPKGVGLLKMNQFFSSSNHNNNFSGDALITKEQYFSLLIYDLEQSFSVKDAACLWELTKDMPKCYAICRSLKKAALIKAAKESNKQGFKYYVDRSLHQALVDFAASSLQPAGADHNERILDKIRQHVVTPTALRSCVKGMRSTLLSIIVARLDASTLAKLCRDQSSKDRRTFLQILYLYRNYWRKFVGTSSEKSVALDFFVKILEKLNANGQDLVDILSLLDKDGRCLLLEIRENKSELAEQLRLAQMVESFGGYRLRPICFERRIWATLTNKLNATSSNTLIQATLRNDVDLVKSLLSQSPQKINEKCEPSGETALTAACVSGYFEIVKILLANGANANVCNIDGVTPLMKAAICGFIEVVKFLLESGAKIDLKDKNGNPALIFTTVGGHLEIVDFLLGKGADLSVSNKKGMTALYYAAQSGFYGIVEMLLKRGGTKAGSASLAFWHAAQNGHMAIAKHLLVHKAKIELDSSKRLAPVLTKTALNGHANMAKFLIERGVKVDARDTEDFTALMHATRHGHLAVVRILLESGAKVNAKKTNGTTALFYAAQYGYLEIAKFLVSKRAQVDARNDSGRTPLMRAAEADQPEIVSFLVENGADVNVKDNACYTALMTAASNGNAKMVKLLFQQGGKVETRNANHQTPLMLAARNGHYNVVCALLECGADASQRDRGYCSALQYAQMGSTDEHYSIIQVLKWAATKPQSTMTCMTPSSSARNSLVIVPSPSPEDMVSASAGPDSIPVIRQSSTDMMTMTIIPGQDALQYKSRSTSTPHSLEIIAEADY